MIDWNAPLRTAGGRPAKLLERQPWQDKCNNARRRVEVCNFDHPRDKREQESVTTWLISEEGRCRGDGRASDFDIVNDVAAMAA